MAKRQRVKGVEKGAPSGFVISLMIHAAAFLLAGMLVVFNVTKKEEKKFIPPTPVDRPKMKLKKPKVKLKKSAKPKASSRIVTKVKSASMPDIQLPEMSGISAGFGGDISGFDLAPDLGEVTLFGVGQSIGNDFIGTFYDFNRNRRGRPVPMDPETNREIISDFLRSGWKTSEFARYYRSPKKLYATTFAVPPVLSNLAPAAFGEEDTHGYCWAALYKGQLVHTEDIRFRFWGQGDDILLVRVDGQVVLNGSWLAENEQYDSDAILGKAANWSSSSADSRKYALGNNFAAVGDWIELKAGVPLDMEVLTGEILGGVFCSLLCIEVEGVEYPSISKYRNNPTLPIFKTEDPGLDLAETIWADLNEGDASVTNGPVFRDYVPTGTGGLLSQKTELETIEPKSEEKNPLRIWHKTNGDSIEAEYGNIFAGKVVLKNKKGKLIKIPLTQISAEDRKFIELLNPPEFKVEFTKTSGQVTAPPASPFLGGDPRPYRGQDYTFGVRIRQKNTSAYNHNLTVEYFAIGEEVDGDNYHLLDRGTHEFLPSSANKRSCEFYGDVTRIEQKAIRSTASMRGTKYGGFLITITDKLGRIIMHKTSHDWLYENRDKLDKIPVGKHFNKDCERVDPPRPGEDTRPSWLQLKQLKLVQKLYT